jgi:hypothetical protein
MAAAKIAKQPGKLTRAWCFVSHLKRNSLPGENEVLIQKPEAAGKLVLQRKPVKAHRT